jgi:probable phosphoglycerate mutase
MSPEEKVQARRYINDSKLQSPEVKSQFIQRLGLGEEEPFKFAKGGVVVPKHTVLNTVGANKKGTQKETKDLKPLVVTTGLKKSAEVPAEMARSGEDIVRGSLDVPLAPQGEEQAKELSRRLKARGGLDTLESSDLHRARQTAKYISEALGVPISVSKSWRPWMLGELEGQPTKKVLDKIHTYITKKPNVKVPGMGEKSTAPGESFVKFKNRVIGQYKEKLKELKRNPYKKIGVVTHYRDLRLAQAWASRGFPQSAEVDTKLMTEKGDDPPISVHRMYWKGSTPKLDKVDMGSREKLPGGIYLVRHGATALNGRDLKGNPI